MFRAEPLVKIRLHVLASEAADAALLTTSAHSLRLIDLQGNMRPLEEMREPAARAGAPARPSTARRGVRSRLRAVTPQS